MNKHYDKARLKRQAEAQRMQDLRQRVSMKGVVIVPKPPKEEMQEIVKQAENNSVKPGKSCNKRFTLIL
jgi:hypothetical protein